MSTERVGEPGAIAFFGPEDDARGFELAVYPDWTPDGQRCVTLRSGEKRLTLTEADMRQWTDFGAAWLRAGQALSR